MRKAPISDLTLEELHNSLIIEEGTDKLLERLEVISVLGLHEDRLVEADDFGMSYAISAYEENHGTYYMEKQPVVCPVAHKLIYGPSEFIDTVIAEWKKGNPDQQDIEEVEAFVDNSCANIRRITSRQ